MPRECTTLLGADFSGKAQHGPARVTKPPPGRRSAGTPATRKTPWSIDKFCFGDWKSRTEPGPFGCGDQRGFSIPVMPKRAGLGGPKSCSGPAMAAQNFQRGSLKLCRLGRDTSHLLCQPIQQAFRACDNATMKFSAISLGLLALLTPLTAAWTKEGMFSVLFWALLQASHTRLPAPENTTFCPNTDQRHLSRQTTRSSAFATS